MLRRFLCCCCVEQRISEEKITCMFLYSGQGGIPYDTPGTAAGRKRFRKSWRKRFRKLTVAMQPDFR